MNARAEVWTNVAIGAMWMALIAGWLAYGVRPASLLPWAMWGGAIAAGVVALLLARKQTSA